MSGITLPSLDGGISGMGGKYSYGGSSPIYDNASTKALSSSINKAGSSMSAADTGSLLSTGAGVLGGLGQGKSKGLGSAIGMGVGMAFGGPLGAAAGAAIGGFVDSAMGSKRDKNLKKAYMAIMPEARRQMVLRKKEQLGVRSKTGQAQAYSGYETSSQTAVVYREEQQGEQTRQNKEFMDAAQARATAGRKAYKKSGGGMF